MVSLRSRVGRLEEKLSASKHGNPFRVIMGLPGESADEAETRYLREHPEDDDSSLFFLVVTQIGATSKTASGARMEESDPQRDAS